MDLSLKERDRNSVLRQVREGVLSAAARAGRIGVTRRERNFALRVSPDTLRGWMMEAGLWKRQRRRAKHRSRRASLGEPERWDSSVHA